MVWAQRSTLQHGGGLGGLAESYLAATYLKLELEGLGRKCAETFLGCLKGLCGAGQGPWQPSLLEGLRSVTEQALLVLRLLSRNREPLAVGADRAEELGRVCVKPRTHG